MAPLVHFAALTGWRRSEVRSLQWRQVDFEAGTVRLAPGKTKNDEGRTLTFGALPPLERLLEVHGSARVRSNAKRAGSSRAYSTKAERRSRASGVLGTGPVSGRGSRAPGSTISGAPPSALERAEVSRSVAIKLTGHRPEAVSRRYAIADSVALEEGVKKLTPLHQHAGGDGQSTILLETGDP